MQFAFLPPRTHIKNIILSNERQNRNSSPTYISSPPNDIYPGLPAFGKYIKGLNEGMASLRKAECR